MISEAINRETLSAFIIALSRQEHSASLQTQLHQIGQQIQDDPALLEQPIVLIQPLLDAYPNLNTAYLQAGLELEQKTSTAAKVGRSTSTKKPAPPKSPTFLKMSVEPPTVSAVPNNKPSPAFGKNSGHRVNNPWTLS
jgi:hypothetical protein